MRWGVGRPGFGRTLVMRAAASVLLAVLLLAGGATVARADGVAAFSSPEPAPGTVVTTLKPNVGVYATDAAGIVSGSLTVDGSSAGTFYLYYPIGHWEEDYDSCEVWWVVDDYTVARPTFIPATNLSYGVHTAVASVTNASGQTSTFSWQFTVDRTPVISAIQPSAGAVVLTGQPLISVTVDDNSSALDGYMTVDGVQVAPAYDSATKTFTYTPPTPLADRAQHTVYFRATDPVGLVAAREWSFRVESGTEIVFFDESPARDATVTAVPVVIGVTADAPLVPISDADSYNVLFLDGVQQTTARSYPVGWWYDDGCEVYYVVEDDSVLRMTTDSLALADGPHTVRAQVRNTSGVTSETVWDFVVAAPPKASQLMPTGTTSNTRPTISAVVTDNGPVPPSVTMRVNGAVVPATFNPSTGVVSYTPAAPLPDGQSSSVVIEMADAGGNTSTAAWSFAVDSAAQATFSNHAPAPDTIVTSSSTTLRATATSINDLVRASTKMWFDGAPVSVSTTQPNSKTITASRSSGTMADGMHIVRMQVTDVLGVSSEESWSFAVSVPPVAINPAPANGTTVNVARPTVAFMMSDNTPGPLNVRLTFNGVVVLDEMRPQGTVQWRPTWDLVNNSQNFVGLVVTDSIGRTRALNWSFKVVAPAPMSDGSYCGNCHVASAHPFGNCSGCHQDYPGYDPHDSNPAAPMGECVDCHGPGGSHNQYYISNCAWCHSGTWAHIPAGHEAATVEQAHVTATAGCELCHATSLVTEHAQYPTDSPFKYQCTTCHASTTQAVRDAIAAPDTRCTACHGATAGHTDLHAGGFTDPNCDSCHEANLTVEHTGGCASCHSSTDPAVTAAIASGEAACWSCHELVGHTELHESALGGNCVDCHDANLVTEHVGKRGLGCAACHVGSSASEKPAKAGAGAPKPSRETPLESHVGLASTPDLGDVADAIASGTTDCEACHDPSYHPEMIVTWGADDYYSWTSTATVGGAALGSLGANPENPGVHAGYQATTAKCGICHSVHRANAAGTRLLDTATATCAGCHRAGTSTVTDVVVSWEDGGPHGSGVDGSCLSRSCHTSSPHGVGASEYAIFAAKLISDGVDAVLEATSGPLSNETSSGITVADLEADPSSGWSAQVRSLVVSGYTCNQAGCHEQTMLAVVSKGWAEERAVTPDAPYAAWVLKTGHSGSAEASATHASYAPVAGCTSCHDQADAATRSGFTFPHSQTAHATASSNTGTARAWLWMTYAGSLGATPTPVGEGDKALDGTCLKCHRDTGGTAGIGITH